MTRKRYIKLLMSYGFSRNQANLLAVCASANRMSYVEASQTAEVISAKCFKIFKESLTPVLAMLSEWATALAASNVSKSDTDKNETNTEDGGLEGCGLFAEKEADRSIWQNGKRSS